MASIYIHIPFCVEKCAYCNFFSVTDTSLQAQYIASLFKEMRFRADYLLGEPIDSLYFGGGTPSLLSPEIIEEIIHEAEVIFSFNPDAEITLEANPNNLDEDYFKRLSQTKINRLSIGIQSFFDENLQVLGRIHNGKQAECCLELAEKYHFSNLSVDLMYGYPSLTENQWLANLEKLRHVNHLSCYSLSLEPNSALSQAVQQKKYVLPTEETVLNQYNSLKSFAKSNRFLHYEISNFCKPDQFSRHNTAYWQNKPYLGLGTAAHSFNQTERQWNIANVKTYINTLSATDTKQEWEKIKGNLSEKEHLTPTMQLNEYLMTSLRTCWGCDLDYVRKRFGESVYLSLQQKVNQLNTNFYSLQNECLILSETGFLLADAVAGELFF
jgi:oxygen-independent coproporphyrinogen-3 oxidase